MERNQGYERQQFADTGLPKRGGRPQVMCDTAWLLTMTTRAEKPLAPKYYQEAQERGDVTLPPVQPTILHHFLQRVRQNMLRAPLHQGLYHGPRLRTAPQRVPPNVVERLCGYGIYYYRRYVGTDNESDIESLSADLHAWYRGVFVNGSIVRFSGDVGQYWSFAGDIRADSKLPKLAAIILSIAVNTAT
ncbi:hypothetical protein GQ600_21641 [Phytophthora cactorum]|nr:hypothetical protein GQ600_21641 [Phytophthora cactorum]